MTRDTEGAPPEGGELEGVEAESEAPQAAGQPLEKKLEQLATMSLLTVGTLMKVIEARGVDALGPEGHEKLEKARNGVYKAIQGLDSWIASEEGKASDLDLSGLRSRLVSMTEQLDIWNLDEEAPPS